MYLAIDGESQGQHGGVLASFIYYLVVWFLDFCFWSLVLRTFEFDRPFIFFTSPCLLNLSASFQVLLPRICIMASLIRLLLYLSKRLCQFDGHFAPRSITNQRTKTTKRGQRGASKRYSARSAAARKPTMYSPCVCSCIGKSAVYPPPIRLAACCVHRSANDIRTPVWAQATQRSPPSRPQQGVRDRLGIL